MGALQLAANFLLRANAKLAAAATAASAAGLALTVAVIGWQIFGRYVLNSSPDWSERLTLFAMNIYIFLAVAVGVREGFHLSLTFFRDALPARARLYAQLAINALICAFGVAMVYYGSIYAHTTWTHTIPTLGISQGLGYAPVPVAGALIVSFAAEHIGRIACQLRGS